MSEELSRKRKLSSYDTAAAETRPSYTMKLFDRTIDLARFNEKTPLFPICRAWIQSQPRKTDSNISDDEPEVPIREEMPNLLTDYLSGAIKDIDVLPKPKEPLEDVPSKAPLLDFQKPSPDMLEALDKHMQFLDTPIDKKTLIKDNLGRWKLVKKHNLDHAKRLEERFEPSLKVIKALYKA